MRTNRLLTLAAGTLLLPLLIGCDRTTTDHGHAEDAYVAPPTNRVDIPAAVRSNLGITFATVERRRVRETLRIPGRFEYLPTAIREYRTMLPGRVEVLVEQFETVRAGTALYRIDSPAWRELMKEIAETKSTITQLQATALSHENLFLAHKLQEESVLENVVIWSERIATLETLKNPSSETKRELVTARAKLSKAQSRVAQLQELAAEHQIEQDHNRAALDAARAHLDLTFEMAASLSGLQIEDLLVVDRTISGAPPAWLTMNTIEVRARTAGIVESIGVTNGAWIDTGENVVTTVQPDRIRFHAFGLQSDLGVLRDGLTATIVPPTPTRSGTAIPMDQTMEGIVQLAPAANATDRTIDLYVVPDLLAEWARPGVAGQLEVVIDESGATELAIPLAAVQRDGLVPVIFRRAPDNPGQAIRLEADLGLDDGRWIEVLSGVGEGDEIVLDGGFQLMLATSGTIQQGGHFHADGTYHEGEH